MTKKVLKHKENACFYGNKFLTRMVKAFKLGALFFLEN